MVRVPLEVVAAYEELVAPVTRPGSVRLKAGQARRRVQFCRQKLVEAEAALLEAEDHDRRELARRLKAKKRLAVERDAWRRHRLIEQVERRARRKSPWHVRAALRIHTPLIG